MLLVRGSCTRSAWFALPLIVPLRRRIHVPATLGGKIFTTKREITDESKRILANTPAGERLRGYDADFAWDLVQHHYCAEEMLRRGCKGVEVRTKPFRPGSYPTKCFHVRGDDDSLVSFSYKNCITKPTRKTVLANVLRKHADPDIQSFIAMSYSGKKLPKCEVTGQVLYPNHGEVDHVVPMSELIEGWLEQEGLSADSVELDYGGGVDGETELLDKRLQSSWKQYHHENAKLQLVQRRVNREKEVKRQRDKAQKPEAKAQAKKEGNSVLAIRVIK